jgi:hypothetical protein
VARDVVRRLDENSGQFTYVREAFDNRRPPERKIVKGDAVSLPVDSLARAARISWFASRLTVAELKLTPPAGASVNLEDEWPEGVIVVEEGGAVRILFDADRDMSGILERLPKLASVLAGVPDGTVLDLCCSPVETLPGSPEDAGLLWLRGPIRAGAWRVGQAWPEVEGATLQSALSLGPEVSIEAFADRFGKVWPVTVRIQEDDSDDDDEGDGLFPTKPIVGLQILVAASGRAYHQTMAMLVSEKIGAEIPKRERGVLLRV